MITREFDIIGSLISKSIGSGKTKVLDRKQMKVLDYMHRNLQNIGIETRIKDATVGLQKQDRIYPRSRQ